MCIEHYLEKRKKEKRSSKETEYRKEFYMHIHVHIRIHIHRHTHIYTCTCIHTSFNSSTVAWKTWTLCIKNWSFIELRKITASRA